MQTLPAILLHPSVLIDVIEHLPAGVFAKDADGGYRFVVWNAEMERLFANRREDMLGRNDYDFFDSKEADYYRQMDESVMRNGRVVDIAIEEVTTSRGKILAHTVKVPIRLADGRRVLLGILEDVTEQEGNRRKIEHYQKHLEQLVAERTAELQKLANTDTLTGLANRAAFFAEVTARTASAESLPFTLIYLDLDRFKLVNDTYGHDFGDQLLAECGRRLGRLQPPVSSVYRVGGDEFAVLVEADVHDQQLDLTCAAIISQFDIPFEVEHYRYTIDASLGMSGFPVDALTPRQLLQHADMAMYAAKHGRRKCRWERYSTQLQAVLNRELEIDQGLRHALEHGELHLVYQPQFDVRDHSRIVGLEALLRWHSAGMGNIPPDVFIPVAENTGLIYQLTDFVLDRVCRDIRQGLDAGRQMPRVSVNVSAGELNDDTPHRVRQVLERYALPGSVLTIEITENAKIKITQASFDRFRELRDEGLRLSIDDFGTGYSSLAYLSHLEVDELKIDKGFIQAATSSKRARSIVQSILGIADAFGYAVVAEGVETEEQAALLAGRADASLQGYWLRTPAPLAEILLD